MLILIIVAIITNASLEHSHPTEGLCHQPITSVSFEASLNGHLIDYCGSRFKVAKDAKTEVTTARCKNKMTFYANGAGPFELPPECDQFGTVHVRLK